jgi:hypothetical protein
MDTDAKPIKTEEDELEEGEILELDAKPVHQFLVAYSSSPPSLVDDSSVLRLLDASPDTDHNTTMASLRSKMDLTE